MSKFFSPLNILIVVVIIGVIYLGYSKIFSSKVDLSLSNKNKGESIENSSSGRGSNQKQNNKENRYDQNSEEGGEVTEKEHKTPDPKLVREESKVPEKIKKKKRQEKKKDGVYQSPTYHYRITYPRDWPLRIRSKKKIALGYVPPKDGNGAVKVSVNENLKEEIQKAEQKAKTQPGISIKEKKTVVDGVQATNYIFINSILGEKENRIVVENYGFDYVIKYTAESPGFVNKAKIVVNNFEFTQ